MMPLFPFNLFREDIFFRVALVAIFSIAVVTSFCIWFALKQLHDWNSTKDIERMREKEDALKNTGATRVFWNEDR